MGPLLTKKVNPVANCAAVWHIVVLFLLVLVSRIMKDLFESEGPRHYISLLQENINRMASNSTNCKTWMITIVCAIFALQFANEAILPYLWITLIPTILFCLLDAYYLGQEKRFRDTESHFVKKVKSGLDYSDDLYSFSCGSNKPLGYFWRGLKSVSTWFLYLTVLIITIVICI